MRRTLSTLLTALAAGPTAVAAAVPRPVVAVSVVPQRQIVERLAGDSVEIVTLLPAGADVETFAPTVRQVAALERAALVFRVGHPAFPLEARLVDRWLAQRPTLPRVSLADHLRGQPGSAPGRPSAEALADPHLWVSPRIVRAAAGELAERLARLLPAEAEAIRGRAVALAADIAALEARLADRLRGGGRFLVDHPSLGHLARDYGLEQLAVERHGKEPTPGELGELVGRARAGGFRHVVVQRNVARRAAEALAREIGAELVEVDPLAADWLANSERIGVSLAKARVR